MTPERLKGLKEDTQRSREWYLEHPFAFQYEGAQLIKEIERLQANARINQWSTFAVSIVGSRKAMNASKPRCPRIGRSR